MNDELTDVERAMLDFAKITWRYKGQQEDAMREQFAVSPTRFWQRIVALVDRPAALAYDPVTVHRLQRLFSRSRAG